MICKDNLIHLKGLETKVVCTIIKQNSQKKTTKWMLSKKNKFETKTGFSIELINWRLEYRGKHENLPLYESIGGEITAIAIVENPAVKLNSIADEETKMLHGIVMRPDLKIFRKEGPNGPENCYWYFSEDTIKTLKDNFKGKIKIGH